MQGMDEMLLKEKKRPEFKCLLKIEFCKPNRKRAVMMPGYIVSIKKSHKTFSAFNSN